ncbi:hypothetical protein [Lactiplantibacillus plantarum]|uniref:hypothetical protein n=1 Tax=Lactiplantibacillus plantarum TaxID=1590 RepID=UPI0020005CB7|nr:hypothetical protein [Lactiplantibacillus plantarum]
MSGRLYMHAGTPSGGRRNSPNKLAASQIFGECAAVHFFRMRARGHRARNG